MDITSNKISGAGKMAPLISFNTIFDLDIGLVNLIRDEYLDKSIFNEDFFNRSKIDIISDIYFRKEDNPLYILSNESVDRKILDEYYSEFIETCQDKIIDKSITTEVINLISLFGTTNEIFTTIFYYTDKQREALEDEPLLENVSKVKITDIDKNDLENTYFQFYIKTVDELEYFKNLKGKSFYISDYGPNMNENGTDIKDTESLSITVSNINNINIFSIYREDIIKRKEL